MTGKLTDFLTDFLTDLLIECSESKIEKCVADELSKFIVEMMGSHREGERVVDGVTV